MNMPPLPIDEIQARTILESIGQLHLLDFWAILSEKERQHLLQQIAGLDLSLFRRQQAALRSKITPKLETHPLKEVAQSGNSSDRAQGKKAVAQGKCAVLVLAGGQGTRLEFEKPKGCFPISNFKNKTLFQLIAEKTKAASLDVNFPIPLAIMCSPLNRAETEDYFATHAYFGLSHHQVIFFSQGVWPFLDSSGNLFLENAHLIAQGPNGNGGVFQQMAAAGIVKQWQERGIEIVNVIPVDNPLALPIDYELIGFHQRERCDATIKAALRRDAREKVGIIALVEGKTQIIEYYEQQFNGASHLANLGLFCFSLNFIEHMSRATLPLHWTQKKASKIGLSKELAWKFEEFIFDVLPLANTCKTLIYPRELTFAPLKNLQGEDSIESVRAALLEADRRIYYQITGIQPPKEAKFELAPEFFYPSESLLKRWKGKSLPPIPYIEDHDS